MGNCKRCLSMVSKNNIDHSLINIYEDSTFARGIPSIWTDWYNRLDSKIMIIGQDWGPFEDMKRLNEKYLENPTKESWVKIMEEERSLTKKQLTKYMVESSNGKITSIDDIFITNAIMCARKGSNYRGNSINLRCSTLNCKGFLLRQIKIIKPKIILSLGYYPLLSLLEIFNFEMKGTLGDVLKKLYVHSCI